MVQVDSCSSFLLWVSLGSMLSVCIGCQCVCTGCVLLLQKHTGLQVGVWLGNGMLKCEERFFSIHNSISHLLPAGRESVCTVFILFLFYFKFVSFEVAYVGHREGQVTCLNLYLVFILSNFCTFKILRLKLILLFVLILARWCNFFVVHFV